MTLMHAQPFIKGEWAADDRESVHIQSPYTGEVIGKQWISTELDVEMALAAAFAAKKVVASLPSYERSRILLNTALRLNQDKERFAELISRELGKPLKYTLNEVSRSIETLQLSGEEAKRLNGETLPGDASDRGTHSIAMTFRVPVGVVAAITPFNAPLNLVCHKVGPAFAAGNSIILKPAPQASLVATEFLRILLASGYPREGIQMLLGGEQVGRQIVKDDRVNVISFTGGVGAAKNICSLAGMKKVLLELGGNSATIVHFDADLRYAAKQCVKSGFSNSGQSCISVQRIFVHHSVLPEFVQLLKNEVKTLKLGDPLLPDTDVGSLVDGNAAKRVFDWIQEAIGMGSTLLCGGGRDGAIVEPTVLLDPPKDSKVVCQEVFGPVVSVIAYETIEEVIHEVNDSQYGLQAGIFTTSIDFAYKVARSLEVGGVIINGTSNFRLDHWPYGGVKNSGSGREGPHYAIQEMSELKMIVYQANN